MLTSCPDCASNVSTRACACPRCGFPVESHFRQIESERQRILQEQQAALARIDEAVKVARAQEAQRQTQVARETTMQRQTWLRDTAITIFIMIVLVGMFIMNVVH